MWTHPKGGDMVKIVEEEVKVLAQMVLIHWVGLWNELVICFIEHIMEFSEKPTDREALKE
jgi:phenolic acid decarboxylase